MKADPDAAAVIFRTVINVVRVLAVLAAPIIPTSAADGARRPRRRRLDVAAGRRASPTSWPPSPRATRWRCPPVLFAKVTDEQQAELEARFGGPDR